MLQSIMSVDKAVSGIGWYQSIFLQFVTLMSSILFPQLLDLCILDVNSLDFQYRTLAAAALCHYTSTEVVKKASGKKHLWSR